MATNNNWRGANTWSDALNSNALIGKSGGAGFIANPLTEPLNANNFLVYNQSGGDVGGLSNVVLQGTKVFNVVNTGLDELFSVDANCNTTIGKTCADANLFIGNAGADSAKIELNSTSRSALLSSELFKASSLYNSISVENNWGTLNLYNLQSPAYSVQLDNGNNGLLGMFAQDPTKTGSFSSNNMTIQLQTTTQRAFIDDALFEMTNAGDGTVTELRTATTTSSKMNVKSVKTSATAKNIDIDLDVSTSNPTLVVRNSLTLNKTTITDTSVTSNNFIGLASSATTATNVTITDTNTAGTYYPVFATNAGSVSLRADVTTTPFTYNPNTGALSSRIVAQGIGALRPVNGQTVTLTSADPPNQTFTSGVGGNATLILPNATTLPVGIKYCITNTSTFSVIVQNTSTFSVIYTIPPQGSCSVLLIDASTANGTWSQIPNLSYTSSSGTDLTIAGSMSFNNAGTSTVSNTGGGTLTVVPTSIRDTTSSTGTANQVLTAGTGAGVRWSAPVGLVRVGSVTVAITGSAVAQNLSFAGLFNSTYKNYKIILRPTTQVTFTTYPIYYLQAFLGTGTLPNTASVFGFEMTSSNTLVVAPVYILNATIASAPLTFAVSSLPNKEIPIEVLNVGYATTATQTFTMMCKSVYANPGTNGASDRTVTTSVISGTTITGLVIQQSSLGVGNNFTLEAVVYGYT